MKNRLSTLCLVFISVLAGWHPRAAAQSANFSDFESIPDQEKKSFKLLRSEQDKGNYLRTMASSNFDVNYYRCEWTINPGIRFIGGKITSYFTITSAADKIVFDLSDTLTVDSVIWHGGRISFQRMPGDGLQLQFPATIPANARDSVSIFYNGVPRIWGTYSPYIQSYHGAGTPIIWTLSEPYGAKEWWPCKNVLDDKADSIDIIVTTPLAYRASSNGVVTNDDISSGSRVQTFKHRYPIASYLVAVAVTNYVVIADSVLIGNKQMPLMLTTYPEFAGNAAKINNNARMSFQVLNEKFGDYPFAKEQYGQTAWGNGGGMEHQTNSFICCTDLKLISHELTHQWFGDKITCGSWRDIWLNEGFATYGTSLVYEQQDRNYFLSERQYYKDLITAYPGGSVWVDDTTRDDRIFDGRLTYYKGSYLLHMLRWKLGDDVFFKAIKRYVTDPQLQYSYAKTSDLQRILEAESGKNLTSFFQQWFYGQGYPIYAIDWKQDSSNRVFLKIDQSVSHPSVSFYDMPVPVQFKNGTRDTIIVFSHTQNGQTYLADPGFKADTAIFDPNFWILAKSSVQHTACSAAGTGDKLFPYYNITWLQNTNNWTYISIDQTNSSAVTAAENIPFYLHFTGNGKDTSIEIKNIRYKFNAWFNTGFAATSVYVTTSCLTAGNYKITKQSDAGSPNEINLFPVPATANLLNISLKNPTDKQLSIALYNASGQLISQRTVATPGRNELFTLPVYHLPKGIYFVKLQSDAAIKTTRRITR